MPNRLTETRSIRGARDYGVPAPLSFSEKRSEMGSATQTKLVASLGKAAEQFETEQRLFYISHSDNVTDETSRVRAAARAIAEGDTYVHGQSIAALVRCLAEMPEA